MTPRTLLALLAVGALAGLPALAAPSAAPVLPERLLVWELPQTLDAIGPAELTVEIDHHGRVTARYTAGVVLEPAAAGRRALEILPVAPAERATFAAMAEAGADVRVRILLDGIVVGDTPVAELRMDPQALPADLRLLPQTHTVPRAGDDGLEALFAAGSDCTDHNACQSDCGDLYLQCLNAHCGGIAWCEQCEQVYVDCVEQCPGCTCVDPKSVTTYTTSTYLGRSWQGSQCYDGWTRDYDGTWWDRYQYTYRVDEYEKTTYCDDTTSTRLLRTWYEYPVCWDEQWLTSCYAVMTGSPWPRCY